MKLGGNQKCISYLSSKGILPSTPIKQKYESDVAQLYKEILKARAEGRPEPTSLPPPKNRNAYIPQQNAAGGRPMTSISSHSSGGGNNDPNGMERLTGESDEQYIARQTRLREEAKARMAAKFGGGGSMGGVGSGGYSGGGGGGSRMGGIGSDPNYNPNGGGYGGGGGGDLTSSVMTGLGSAFGALSTVATTVAATVQDEGTRRELASTASSFWGGISSGASSFVSSMTQPDGAGSDGLDDLQAQFHSQRSANPNSKYSGFGSDSMMRGGGAGMMGGGGGAPSNNVNTFGGAAAAPTDFFSGGGAPTQSTLTEARPGPGEDPNGIERLSGESDEQYVMRQTRLRDEAKARMAAKFGGGGGMSGVGSSGIGNAVQPNRMPPASTMSAPSSGNGMYNNPMQTQMQSAPSSGNSFGGVNRTAAAAPSSGNATKVKVTSGGDFFANFGA